MCAVIVIFGGGGGGCRNGVIPAYFFSALILVIIVLPPELLCRCVMFPCTQIQTWKHSYIVKGNATTISPCAYWGYFISVVCVCVSACLFVDIYNGVLAYLSACLCLFARLSELLIFFKRLDAPTRLQRPGGSIKFPGAIKPEVVSCHGSARPFGGLSLPHVGRPRLWELAKCVM